MMRKRENRRVRKDSSGQAVLEFVLTLFLLMGFLMFFLRLAMVFAFGNYAHYGVFMAARAYLASSENRDDQVRRAESVISSTLKQGGIRSNVDRYPLIALAEPVQGSNIQGLSFDTPEFKFGDSNLSWMQGVRYKFRSKLFTIPMGGLSGRLGPLNTVKLTAESWLGREPTFSECRTEMSKVEGYWDNGC